MTVPPYRPYSPDLTFTDSRLVGLLGNALRGRLSAVDDDSETAYVKIADASAKGLTRKAYIFSRKGGKSVLVMGISWKHHLNFVKDVPMKYVNFIIIVIIVSEKIWGDS